MICWQDECENPVQASCPFCGRFVCKEHASRRPNILAMFLGSNSTPKVVPVGDAIWCGLCDPQDAIPMPELY